MKASPAFEFPPEQQRALRKARRLEWLTIGYLLTVVLTMYLVLGSSQAMKTAWLEDVLSLIPPAVFLVANRIASWQPNERFPYGYHRVTSIAFLCAALALLTMGLWLLGDATYKLVTAERPTIGGITLFGKTIWLGWLMLPVLLWSAAPAFFLGRAKLPPARYIHDKVLYTDADMNKADWMTASAAMIGVVGVGLGFWWTDAVAAMAISLSVTRDGFANLREVITNLMNEAPKVTDRSGFDPLPEQIQDLAKQLPWVSDARVRMREEGHVYFGEVFLVISDATDLVNRLSNATRQCAELNWRVHDIVLVPVTSLDDSHRREKPARGQ
jgi:cation diffusion facilitator family transporter